MKRQILFAIILTLFSAAAARAQTGGFTYQGRLTVNAIAANGIYDINFTLCDSATGDNQVALPVTRFGVVVTGGVFTVQLDFNTPNVFNGDPRYLMIAIKRPTEQIFVTLMPRQQLTSAPYAVRSLSSAVADRSEDTLNVGGTPASQIVKEGDSRLTDTRMPSAGSTNYVQNRSTPQASTNFDINGTGTANILNARVLFSLNGQPVLSQNGVNNLFVGRFAGDSITTGTENTFMGENAGFKNSTGAGNSFFGLNAGYGNTSGVGNSAFGRNAGLTNSVGEGNSFFGYEAGRMTTSGHNSFFGHQAGQLNTTGENNTFIGSGAGRVNTEGDQNTFIGPDAGERTTIGSANLFVGSVAGRSNVTGSGNTIIGTGADVGSSNLVFATAIGANAKVFSSNTIALGRPDGSDKVALYGLAGGGSTQLCRTPDNLIGTCSSSLRYKTNLANFTAGLSFVQRLRPISFTWIEGGMRDVGFGAEEVAQIDPTFVIFNQAGQVEGLKYDRLGVVFINAFKEQQIQIDARQNQIDEQARRIETLRKLVCSNHPNADICRSEVK